MLAVSRQVILSIKKLISSYYYPSSKLCQLSHLGVTSSVIEKKISIDDVNVNYLKTGFGDHSILCLPGLLGSIWTDFPAQITGIDLTKFTLIILEPPGYGKSRPPERDFTPGFHERDADIAFKLLKELNVNKCSLLGWSDGGVTSIFLAAKHPDLVRKMVIWGSNSYVTEEDISLYEKIRDLSNWSASMRKSMSSIYGDKLQDLVDAWIDANKKISRINDGNICKQLLPIISAPTIILHGCNDPLVPQFHADFLHKHIKNSKLHLIQDGKHNLHIKYAEMFNKIVQLFLRETKK